MFLLKSFFNSGVLGLNSRNIDYIFEYNDRKYYPNADSKFLTKKLATTANIPVPELHGLISFANELNIIKEMLYRYKDIVIKPEHGSGGNGIMIVKEEGGKFFSGKSEIAWMHIRYHATNILSGLYSLGGRLDRILIEEKVSFSPIFKDVTYMGVPDIRVIVFKGIPVMAMLRLPTSKSDGKANLHQGAVGVGIDIKTGRTMCGVIRGKEIEIHPDTKNKINDIKLPDWRLILEIAIKAGQIFNLGYMGVDIVYDDKKGPLLLETNVRPGLAIQLANKIGLKQRLKFVKALDVNNLSIAQKIDLAINTF